MTPLRSIVLSIVLLTITAAGASAQSLHFGVQAGTNLFKLSGQSFDNKFKAGYSAGVYADLGIAGKWGLKPELLFNESAYETTS